MHPSCRTVRRMSVVASWLTDVVGAFLHEGEVAGSAEGGLAELS